MSLFNILHREGTQKSAPATQQTKLRSLIYRQPDFHRIKILVSSMVNEIKHQEPPDVKDYFLWLTRMDFLAQMWP